MVSDVLLLQLLGNLQKLHQTAEKRFYSSFHRKANVSASRNLSSSKEEGFGVVPVSNVWLLFSY